MYNNGLIWLGNTDAGEQVCLLPGKANRHGLVAGATGTGKTVTLKVMAESFSDMGVPVFMADVKGDLASIMKAGTDSEDMQERIRRFGLAEAGFNYQGYPVNIWDIYGKNGPCSFPGSSILTPCRQTLCLLFLRSRMTTTCC